MKHSNFLRNSRNLFKQRISGNEHCLFKAIMPNQLEVLNFQNIRFRENKITPKLFNKIRLVYILCVSTNKFQR